MNLFQTDISIRIFSLVIWQVAVLAFQPETRCQIVHCGYVLHVPCSCRGDCVLLKTCCKHFENDCPELYKNPMALYERFLHHDFTCSNNEFAMISSCLIPPDHTERRSGINAQVTEPNTKVVSEPARSTSGFSLSNNVTLLTALEKSPVTDTDTGIVFQNMSVYRCNMNSSTHFKLWEPILPRSMVLEDDNMKPKDDQISIEALVYLPPPSFSLHPNCIPNLIQTCNNSSESDKDIELLCLNHTNYVYTEKNGTKSFYRNLYCYFCNGGNNDTVYSKDTFTPDRIRLKITFNLLDERRLVLTSHEVDQGVATWTQAVCHIGQLENLDNIFDNNTCKVLSCMQDYSLRADGRCKQLRPLSIALQEDDFDFSATELLQLPVLLACLAKDPLCLDVETIEQTEFIFNERRNMTMAAGQMMIYADQKDVVEERTLALAVYLAAYRDSRIKSREMIHQEDNHFSFNILKRYKKIDIVQYTVLNYSLHAGVQFGNFSFCYMFGGLFTCVENYTYVTQPALNDPASHRCFQYFNQSRLNKISIRDLISILVMLFILY